MALLRNRLSGILTGGNLPKEPVGDRPLRTLYDSSQDYSGRFGFDPNQGFGGIRPLVQGVNARDFVSGMGDQFGFGADQQQQGPVFDYMRGNQNPYLAQAEAQTQAGAEPDYLGALGILSPRIARATQVMRGVNDAAQGNFGSAFNQLTGGSLGQFGRKMAALNTITGGLLGGPTINRGNGGAMPPQGDFRSRMNAMGGDNLGGSSPVYDYASSRIGAGMRQGESWLGDLMSRSGPIGQSLGGYGMGGSQNMFGNLLGGGTFGGGTSFLPSVYGGESSLGGLLGGGSGGDFSILSLFGLGG